MFVYESRQVLLPLGTCWQKNIKCSSRKRKMTSRGGKVGGMWETETCSLQEHIVLLMLGAVSRGIDPSPTFR
jgi:hypothetical protein